MKNFAVKLTASAVAALAISATMAAQNLEQVVCTDNSVYEGFISEQKSGVSMSVYAEKATIVVDASQIRTVMEETIPVSELTPEWQQWVKENLPENTQKVTLESFSCGTDAYNRVYITERGSYITFVDLTKREYQIPWANVLCTRKTLRAANEFSGVNDVIITKEGDKYEGQITEQVIGKFVKLRTEEGKLISINPAELKSLHVEKINSKTPLFSQIRLLDVITVDGKAIEGCITSREFGKNLLLTMKDGRVKEYPLSKVSVYAKRLNPDYVSLTDRVIEKDAFYMDGEAAELDTLVRKDIGYILQDSVTVVKKIGDKVMAEINKEDSAVPVFVVKASTLEVNKVNSKGKPDPKAGTETILVAKYSDMVENPVKVKRTVSPLGNINIELLLKDAGIYVLFVQGMDKGLVIKAE